jgi:hypothetical protein
VLGAAREPPAGSRTSFNGKRVPSAAGRPGGQVWEPAGGFHTPLYVLDSVLRVAARDPDPHVRLAVAYKRKLDADLFAALAADEEEAVRARIAWNRKVPRSLLEQLADDPSWVVRDAAREGLSEQARR